MNYLIWDFDGTLGYRIGSWSAVLVDVLRRELPDCTVQVEDIRPYMRTGFPWHSPNQPSPPNRSAEDWWNALSPVFERALLGVAQLSPHDAQRIAGCVRHYYSDTAQWRLYDDTLPCLRVLSEKGWQHVVLSNHVPELSGIIQALGLSPYIDAIFNSAVTGFEKPHPGAFLGVLDSLNDAADVWMVGDNPIADVAGAEAVGLRAILVRTQNPGVRYYSKTLAQIVDIVDNH